MVVKKDGTREPYKRDKAETGIWNACTKRPVSVDQVTKLLKELESQWSTSKEVPSEQLGNDIMRKIKEIDEIAYVRFASVYRRFKDVEEFKKELDELL